MHSTFSASQFFSCVHFCSFLTLFGSSSASFYPHPLFIVSFSIESSREVFPFQAKKPKNFRFVQNIGLLTTFLRVSLVLSAGSMARESRFLLPFFLYQSVISMSSFSTHFRSFLDFFNNFTQFSSAQFLSLGTLIHLPKSRQLFLIYPRAFIFIRMDF